MNPNVQDSPSDQPTHYVGLVIWREMNGEIEFLVIDSKSIDPRYRGRPKQTKFVGGTNNDHLHEMIKQTRERETTEETDLVIVGEVDEIYKDTKYAGHKKYFYIVNISDCSGTLRKVPKIDNGDLLSEPYWVKAKELTKKIYRSHLPAHEAAMKKLWIA
ncbi:MAG: hypothetical protein WA048_00895 [Minisyncoccia bacterium]